MIGILRESCGRAVKPLYVEKSPESQIATVVHLTDHTKNHNNCRLTSHHPLLILLEDVLKAIHNLTQRRPPLGVGIEQPVL